MKLKAPLILEQPLKFISKKDKNIKERNNRLYPETWVPAVRYIPRKKARDAASIRAKELAIVYFWKNSQISKV